VATAYAAPNEVSDFRAGPRLLYPAPSKQTFVSVIVMSVKCRFCCRSGRRRVIAGWREFLELAACHHFRIRNGLTSLPPNSVLLIAKRVSVQPIQACDTLECSADVALLRKTDVAGEPTPFRILA
jgi:hypothetical protein